MRNILIFLFLSLNVFAFSSIDAEIDIEKNVDSLASLSLIEDVATAGSSAYHQKMFGLLVNDLKMSGHFNVDTQVRRASFEDGMIPPELHDREYLLKYSYASSGMNINAKLVRVADNQVVFQKAYSVNAPSRFPFLSHNAIVDVNRALGLEDVSWMNRYLLFSKYTASRNSEIWIADYTLLFASPIVRGGLNLFPKWGNTNQSNFYYTSYNDALPTLYRVDMLSGSRQKIVSSQGMLVCSDVSQDGSRLLLTMAPHGQPDVYEYNVNSGSSRQITQFGGIDVNGKYIGDESRIVFVSDRVGRANIYMQPIGSYMVSKVANYGNNNSSCDAFGQKILYSVKEGGATNIYLGSVNGTETQPLTSNGSNQYPHFSNNGDVILYIKQNGGRNMVGYLNLATKESALYPMQSGQIQSLDW